VYHAEGLKKKRRLAQSARVAMNSRTTQLASLQGRGAKGGEADALQPFQKVFYMGKPKAKSHFFFCYCFLT